MIRPPHLVGANSFGVSHPSIDSYGDAIEGRQTANLLGNRTAIPLRGRRWRAYESAIGLATPVPANPDLQSVAREIDRQDRPAQPVSSRRLATILLERKYAPFDLRHRRIRKLENFSFPVIAAAYEMTLLALT